jgi:penicillin-binding protein 1A
LFKQSCFCDFKEAIMNPKTKAGSSGVPKKNKQRTPARKFFFTVAKILIVFFIALTFALVGIVGGAVVGYIRSTPEIDEQLLTIRNQNSTVYDMTEKKEIATLTGSENKNREVVTYDKIPKYLKDAFVSIEDERFYKHHGVDLKRTLGATISFITTGGNARYGGSTITQQVVQNITENKKRSPQRKIQEWWKATKLENKLEKWQILELYMNIIYMGRNYYGVQSASNAYFGKDVGQLSLAESAALAGITNLPGRYSPISEKGKKNCLERQKLVLQKMLENSFITKTEYDQAIAENITFKERDKSEDKVTSKQTYFVDQVIRDVAKDLMDKYGYSKELAYTWIYNYGLKIYTTEDSEVQSAMDEVFLNEKDYFPGKRNKKGELPQAAMTVIDPNTGELRAVYGGRGAKTADSVLNRATQAKRQAGSSFKPIADYGPALDQHLITASTVVDDVPVYMMGPSKGMYPQNFPESLNGKTYRVYRGLTTIRTAIYRSINVVAAKTWMKLGADTSFEYLEKSGINTNVEDKYLSIALGGLKGGVNPLVMGAAYVPFAHKGMYLQPITYTRVEDSKGNVILDKKKDAKIKQKTNIVYEQSTAFIMTDMMKDTCRPGGTAAYTAFKNAKGKQVQIAGKTGTTNDDKDRWFLGYSPYYVGAVWYGYDTPTPVVLSGSKRNPSAVIWNAVMKKIHQDIDKPEDFPMPTGVVKKAVCIKSGKVPTDLCTRDQQGNAVREEYFIKGTEPKDNDLCDVHVAAIVDGDPKSVDTYGRPLLADKYCSSPVEKVFIRRPEPYMPANAGDPYPEDWKYEVPIEYCPFHSSSGAGASTTSNTPGSSNQQTDPNIINGSETPNQGQTPIALPSPDPNGSQGQSEEAPQQPLSD